MRRVKPRRRSSVGPRQQPGPRPIGPRPIGPRPIGPRPIGPRPIRPRPIGPRPIGPRPFQPGPNVDPAGPRPEQVLPKMQPSSQIDPSSPRNLIFANPVKPNMQGIGDPRSGAATIPGNQLQMQMRGPTQAAPTQPVTAMKKGGVVRGGRAEIKGTRPAKLS
jgi:hypothetical protein